MNITVNLAQPAHVSAIGLADLIAGRPVEKDELPDGLTPESAFEAADAYFKAQGVTDRESYVALRDRLRAELRNRASDIRRLKEEFRYLDGNHSAFYTVQGKLEAERHGFQVAHDLRRLGKAWSVEARRRRLASMPEMEAS